MGLVIVLPISLSASEVSAAAMELSSAAPLSIQQLDRQRYVPRLPNAPGPSIVRDVKNRVENLVLAPFLFRRRLERRRTSPAFNSKYSACRAVSDLRARKRGVPPAAELWAANSTTEYTAGGAQLARRADMERPTFRRLFRRSSDNERDFRCELPSPPVGGQLMIGKRRYDLEDQQLPEEQQRLSRCSLSCRLGIEPCRGVRGARTARCGPRGRHGACADRRCLGKHRLRRGRTTAQGHRRGVFEQRGRAGH